MRNLFSRFPGWRELMVCAVSFAAPTLLVAQTTAPGERISINSDWRFQMGDPAGLATPLDYDVRPKVIITEDGKAADAEPTEAEKVAASKQQVLKPWILPSGNAFIKDSARHHRRPAGHPGSDVSYVQASFDDKSWRNVTLPHDWAITGPFIAEGPYGGMGRLPSWGIGWYRKKLEIAASDRDRSIFLDIDGAMSYATVWLNGKLVGGWPYGYNSFRLDLTPHVVFGGENQLAVRLDNPPHSARWYPGGGLYRNVWLTKTHRVHVSHWGTQVTTPQVSKLSASIDVAVSVDNDSQDEASVDVATDIYAIDVSGKRVGGVVARIKPQSVRIAAGGTARALGSTTLANPRLWGPPPTQTPHRYVAVTTVSRGGKAIDRYETRFGIRSVRLDPNTGVYVNDERIPLNGVNNHHDLGALGAAFNVRAAERQLEMLQEMGANALRMSHNPPAPELLELTDRMGILVMDEVFDAWERKKTPLDFHLIFPDWHEQDLRSMLRRDRNNPSVIMWSVGNEVGEQYTGEDGANIARKLVNIVREEDPTRLATTAMNWAKPDMPLPGAVDVISLNYQGAGIRSLPGQFPAFRERFPDKVILSSESASALSSRGEYQFPVSGSISGPVRPGSGGDPKTRQVSAYELHAADFGSSADRAFAAQDQHPYVAGEFVWTGWDYLGEPTPYYSSRSSYSGIIDLAGFKKDRFYLYQARWRPDLPLAHLLPHWTWPGREGEVTPVHLITSGDEAELFVNGKSQGRKKRAAYEYRLRWDYVTYEPGEIRAVSYKNGEEWASTSVRTADAPAKLELAADRSRIQADGMDLSFVTVRVLDKNGLPAPTAKNPIRFTVEGPGELVATDNGDPTSFVPFQSSEREAFNGLALAIVRGKPNQAGKITLRAESAGLEGASVVLSTARGRK
ncbi:MAG TPA: beta-galactosidase GalB [Steroidobacter sp.]|uniref:beta-galactosidase GalB n=1 Tax=Steroidobacter sp. TaxID=1978227 RepID=UPI002EDA700F